MNKLSSWHEMSKSVSAHAQYKNVMVQTMNKLVKVVAALILILLAVFACIFLYEYDNRDQFILSLYRVTGSNAAPELDPTLVETTINSRFPRGTEFAEFREFIEENGGTCKVKDESSYQCKVILQGTSLTITGFEFDIEHEKDHLRKVIVMRLWDGP
jgi:uncharacterized membrane protein YqiK